MFQINSVSLSNFKSYAGDHTFDLPTEPGLYFLTGSNRDEPSLGANGAGKSTLLDAIYWCLYGRTPRGLKAADVVTWGERSCTVSVSLNVAGTEMIVIRTQSPNSLEIDFGDESLTLEQEALLKHIVLNADAFVYSVILPQFGQSFFELKPADKLSLFSQIMNLDFWLEKSQLAAEATKALERQVDKTSSDIQNTKEFIISATVDIKELAEKEAAFEDERTAAMKGIEAKADKLDADLNELDKRKKRFTGMIELFQAERIERIEALQHAVKARDKHNSRREQLNKELFVLRSKLKELEQTVDSLGELGAECPTCLQIVPIEHLKLERKKLLAKCTTQRERMKQVEAQLFEVQKFVVKIDADTKQLDDALNYTTDEYNNARAKLGVIGERFDAVSRSAAELATDLRKRETEANPYASMHKERKAKLASLNSKLAEQQELFKNLNAQHEATSYWVNGFKRIRLFIIEETLRSLEVEVNNNLASLGLVDWQVEFDIERENKSGGITKGFTVFIKCPSNPDPVRWESWSGGETQRLQLAGDFGLANLIMTQAGLRNTIEFYDEPSAHLSDEGLVDLAETLRQRAITDNKAILLVDHRMPDFGEFAGVFTVVKDKHGSRIKKAP